MLKCKYSISLCRAPYAGYTVVVLLCQGKATFLTALIVTPYISMVFGHCKRKMLEGSNIRQQVLSNINLQGLGNEPQSKT